MPAYLSWISESVALAPVPGSFDRASGVLRAVPVLRASDRVGESVLRAALPLLSAPVNFGPSVDAAGLPVEVSPYARFGRLRDPRLSGGAVVADLAANPAHESYPPLAWALENDANAGGFVLETRMLVRYGGGLTARGEPVVAEILDVAGVDVTVGRNVFKGTAESRVAAPPARAGKSALELLIDGLLVNETPAPVLVPRPTAAGLVAGYEAARR